MDIQPLLTNRIHIYYLWRDQYNEIQKGTARFIKNSNPIYIDIINHANEHILYGFIGINGKPHTPNGIIYYTYYSERMAGKPGVFTTDGVTFYEILDFIFTPDDRVQLWLKRISNDDKLKNETGIQQKDNSKRKKRPTIPAKIKALLQKEINSKCPFCISTDVDHFHYHHINENPSNNEVSNLLMVCPLCHSKITKRDISKEEVIEKKKALHAGTVTKDIPLTSYQQVNYGNKNLQIIGASNIELNQNTTKIIRNVVQPSGNHITEEQSHTIKRLIDDIVEIIVSTSKSGTTKGKYYPLWWKKLYDKYEITSYKLLPRDKFNNAESWLHQQIAILRPKLRRNNNDEWKNQHYKAIYAKANSLNLSKEELYQVVMDKLELENISSLKDLNDRQLKQFYDKIMRMN